MKKKAKTFAILSLAILLFLLNPLTSFTFEAKATAANKESPPQDFMDNQVLVKFQSWAEGKKQLVSNLHDGKLRGEIEETGYSRVKLDKGGNAVSAALHLSQDWRVEKVELNYKRQVAVAPNDPLYDSQWALARIGAEVAWDIGVGASNPVVIAVVDTGVDLDHPDLAEKIVPGYNFIANNDNPMDDNGHGTHVAGIAAAVGNNGVGVSGVNWSSRIMPIKALDASGTGNDYLVAQGIIWAADHGANVINLSFGGTQYSSVLEEAIEYSQQKGVLVVAAAGNEAGNGNPVFYPAALEGVIAVGATDGSDNRAPFSGFGSYLDISAPGVYVLSTGWDDGYSYMSGTSMSAPFVSGAAGLILSLRPNMPRNQVEERIKQSADDLGEAGRDDQYGYGRINLAGALNGLSDDQGGRPPTLGRAAIQGKVVSEEKHPLEGVKIETEGKANFSDSNGGFQFFDLPSGIYHLTYSATGYYSQKQEYITVSNGTTMPPTAVLSKLKGEIGGKVVDQRGKGIPRAVVRIEETVMPTDGEGRFRFTLIGDGIYTIYYDATGYGGQVQENIGVAGGPVQVPTVIMN